MPLLVKPANRTDSPWTTSTPSVSLLATLTRATGAPAAGGCAAGGTGALGPWAGRDLLGSAGAAPSPAAPVFSPIESKFSFRGARRRRRRARPPWGPSPGGGGPGAGGRR